MYFGQHQTSLDEKGRITVPRKFRDIMKREDHITWHVTRGYDGNLVLYNREGWANLMERINSLNPMDPRAQDLSRLILGNVAEVRVDGQGRMLAPRHLRELAGLEREGVLVGMNDRLEIWSKEAWDAYQQTHAPRLKQMVMEMFVSGEQCDSSNGRGRPDDER